MFELPATIIRRCKKCGHFSVTHINGKNVEDDFIYIKGENIFKNEELCPICKSTKYEHETDHKTDTCPCNSCKENRRNEMKKTIKISELSLVSHGF